MGNAFRNQPAPTLYPDNKTPVTEDVLEVGLLFAASIVAFSFILIIPGIRGIERLWATVRVFTALFIGTVILVSNFGYCWYCGIASAPAPNTRPTSLPLAAPKRSKLGSGFTSA